MACHLMNGMLLFESMLQYCWFKLQEQTSVKSYSKFMHFVLRKCIWKCEYNGGKFILASMRKYMSVKWGPGVKDIEYVSQNTYTVLLFFFVFVGVIFFLSCCYMLYKYSALQHLINFYLSFRISPLAWWQLLIASVPSPYDRPDMFCFCCMVQDAFSKKGLKTSNLGWMDGQMESLWVTWVMVSQRDGWMD